MSAALTVSVVIVSRHRPEALRRCLLGLSQQYLHPFEVVVVADPASLRSLPAAAQVKEVAFDEANISAARNLGIAAAAGELVAFIDDDSVAEPTWLQYLAAPFDRAEVTAAGGFVRGRNGISWQSRGAWVDHTGRAHPLEVTDAGITLLTGARGRAIKTEGTNMAVRRAWLAENGGFDPRFRFFLDETDLNMRLGAAGAVTAVVPQAQVHHGFAASARRRGDRVPRDLTEIGASWAVFMSRHCPEPARDAAWHRVIAAERRRLLRHMVRGGLEPRDVRRLMAGLLEGFEAGLQRAGAPVAMTPLPHPTQPFRPLGPCPPRGAVVIAGRPLARRSLHRRAVETVAAGRVATVMRFSRSTLFHRLAFQPDGYWLQTGGIFGRSLRDQPLFRAMSLASRVAEETARTGDPRGLNRDPNWMLQNAHCNGVKK